ncbi:MAG: DUF1858 domain-containing protein [Candidatus Woesearchaeota archaeon]
MTKELITRDMLILEIVQTYPKAAEIFGEYGLACVGCHVSSWETIEEGARGHGMDEQTIDMMLADANELAVQEQDEQEQTEHVRVSVSATTQIKNELIKKQKPFGVFRLEFLLETSDFFYSVQDGATATDQLILSDGAKIVTDSQTYQKLSGCTIDYQKDSGFVIRLDEHLYSCKEKE